MATVKEFIETARSAVGVPWHRDGRLAPHGVDCIGLICWALRKLGVSDYEPGPSGENIHTYTFMHTFRQHCEEVPKSEMKPGDILVFKSTTTHFPCHCGILSYPRSSGEPQFIHAYAVRKKVVEEVYSDEWRRKTVAVFRIPGLES